MTEENDYSTLLPSALEEGIITIDPSLLSPPYPLHNTTEWDNIGSGQGLTGPASDSLLHSFPAFRPGQAPDIHPEKDVPQPLTPCSHCRRHRLRCFILQTTSHNPNPVRSCSSCVALFQDCSLAEQGKRQACDFETPQPVIGRLHGIPDVEVSLNLPSESFHPVEDPRDIRPLPNKRLHSRSVRKTQFLRNWFSTHLDHPYPSEEEKSWLIEQSGLSKKQVTDWFTNARRRQRLAYRPTSRKVFRQGSPMPSLSDMSPLERWRHSPPDEEPVSTAVIERALSESLDTTRSTDPSRGTECGSYSSSNFGDLAADMSEYSFHQTSDSASSCLSLGSGDILSILSSSVHTADGHSDTTTGHPVAGAFSCTTCMRTFKKKSDMRRHIASVHRTSHTRWVCAYPLSGEQSPWVWRIGQAEPECVLCGHAAPDEDHFGSHEFESCSNRPVEDRTFLRKDHLWQHLYKFHGCRRWEGWSGDLEQLQQKTL